MDKGIETARVSDEATTKHAAELPDELAQMRDRWLRSAAELENYRKRVARDLDEAGRTGRDELLTELLPLFDGLTHARAHATPGDAVAEGVRLLEQQLQRALAKFEVTRFSAEGAPFDPARHHALEQVETRALLPGTVAKELAPGYLSGQRLLRPALVAVAKAPAEANAATDAQPSDEGEK